MPVLQCPKCELRFTTTSELDDHLLRDHDDPATPEPEIPGPRKGP